MFSLLLLYINYTVDGRGCQARSAYSISYLPPNFNNDTYI